LRSGKARRVASTAAFLLLAVFFAREAVFGGRTFFLRDLHLQWFGQVESFVRALASGSWPLWDPYVSFGQPMLANANVQVLYPLTWLNLLMRPTTYYTVYFVLHLVLAGVGTAALARRWGASEAGAVVAGAAWIASGPFLSLGSLWNHLAGAAWMPWTLLGVDHALDGDGSRRGVAGWALALAATILAGSPDFALLGLVPVGALLVERLEWRRPMAEGNRRAILTAGLAVGLGLGLAAAQLLPSLEVARRSIRWSMGLASRAYWSAHPAALLQALIPISWDALPWRAQVSAALFESREPYLPSLYLGLPVLALAACGLVTPTARHRVVLGVSALVCALLALGSHTPAYSAAVALFPLLRAVRFPVKAMVPAALCISLLAGFGFESWRARAVRAGAALWVGAGVAAVTAGSLALLLVCRCWPDGLAALLLDPGAASIRGVLAPVERASAELVALGLLTLLLAILGRRTPRAARTTSAILAALALVELAGFHAGLNPTAPVDLFRWHPEALKAVEQADARRLFVYDYNVQPDASRAHLGRNVAYAVPAAPSADELWRGALGMRAYPVPPVGAAYGVFDSFGRDLLGIQPLPLFQLNAALFASEGTPGFHRLLRIGAVSQVLALHQDGLEALRPERRFHRPFFEDIRLFQVPEPSPRAFLAGEARVGDLEMLLDRRFDPARAVVLPEPGPPLAASGFHGEARLIEMRADRVRMEADASAPGLLVLVDTYDPGWRARVDGEPAPVLRANVAFRAVPVPAGRHRVEMVYRPTAVMLGLVTSLVAALLLAAWAGGAFPSGMLGSVRGAAAATQLEGETSS
jgi:hypothetical protein